MTTNNTAVLEHSTTEKSAEVLQFLTFIVDNEEYGVDIMKVREIKGWAEATRLPNTPGFARGVINLRGNIIPVFDLRARFNKGATDADDKNVVIVLAAGQRTIGVLVDMVSDILNTQGDQIRPAPTTGSDVSISKDFITGLISVEQRMVILLNIDELFNLELLKKAEKALEG